MTKIVVAGGGIGGFSLIRDLQKKQVEAHITLIEPKDYLEIPFAQLRALVDPKGFGTSIRKDYRALISGVNHVKGRLKRVDEKRIILESGDTVDFDYLVLATGSSSKSWSYLNGSDSTIEERQKSVELENSRLQSSKSVLIIGGGPVGVETAGEIAHAYPDKKVILAEGGNRILGPVYSEKMTDRAEKVLKAMNVEIYTNSFFNLNDEGYWINQQGDKIEADMVIPAVGTQINTHWAGDSAKFSTTEKGQIKVDATLRIPGTDNIFVIGDINDVPELKLGVFAGYQAKIAAENIAILLSGKTVEIKEYKPSKPLGFVTLGPKKAAVQLPFGHPHFLGAIKQKDFFASMYLKS